MLKLLLRDIIASKCIGKLSLIDGVLILLSILNQLTHDFKKLGLPQLSLFFRFLIRLFLLHLLSVSQALQSSTQIHILEHFP